MRHRLYFPWEVKCILLCHADSTWYFSSAWMAVGVLVNVPEEEVDNEQKTNLVERIALVYAKALCNVLPKLVIG